MTTTPAESLIARINDEFDAFAGRAGVSATNLGTGEMIRVNGDAETATASTIKVPILIELYRQAEAGDLQMTNTLTYTAAARVPGSGILRDLAPEIELSLANLATLMIILSDNSATNMLIDLLGIDNINATMESFGFPRTDLLRRIDFAEIGNDARRLAITTTDDLAGIMAALATGAILSPASCEAILDTMHKQHYRTLTPRYLPFTAYAPELNRPDNGLRIANKTGSWLGMRADMSLIEFPTAAGPVRYVIGISIEGEPDTRFWTENPGDQMVGRVSRLIFDHFGGGELDVISLDPAARD